MTKVALRDKPTDRPAGGVALPGHRCGAGAVAGSRGQRLRGRPSVEVGVAEFERRELPAEPFDKVVCATAFHWLDPAVRVVEAARALRPGGPLALVTTAHVAGGTLDFFARAQRCYERWDPATPPGLRLVPEAETATDTGESADSRFFDTITVGRHAREITYTADEYIDVLLTHSGHRALDEPSRQGLPADIRDLIEDRFGGSVTERYVHEVITARRVAR